MKIKIRPADRVYSQYVRLRDRSCTRCGSPVVINEKGLPISHQASHFYGRRKESVRYDEKNVTTHCGGCHSFLTANPAIHKEWKIQQIGQEEFDLLTIRANTSGKRDDAMSLLVAKNLLKSVLNKPI